VYPCPRPTLLCAIWCPSVRFKRIVRFFSSRHKPPIWPGSPAPHALVTSNYTRPASAACAPLQLQAQPLNATCAHNAPERQRSAFSACITQNRHVTLATTSCAGGQHSRHVNAAQNQQRLDVIARPLAFSRISVCVAPSSAPVYALVPAFRFYSVQGFTRLVR